MKARGLSKSLVISSCATIFHLGLPWGLHQMPHSSACFRFQTDARTASPVSQWVPDQRTPFVAPAGLPFCTSASCWLLTPGTLHVLPSSHLHMTSSPARCKSGTGAREYSALAFLSLASMR
eukprot:5903603-Pyramimonas_sp.AAC.2